METNILIFVGLLLFIFTLGALGLLLKRMESAGEKDDEKSSDHYPYTSKPYILSPAEYSFYKTLVLQVPEHLLVMVKIRMADIIGIESGLDKSAYNSAWNRIKSKHFDFVIVDKKTCTVQSIIELDDASHNSKKAEKGDLVKDKACEAAGITMHRVPAKRGYTASDLSALI